MFSCSKSKSQENISNFKPTILIKAEQRIENNQSLEFVLYANISKC